MTFHRSSEPRARGKGGPREVRPQGRASKGSPARAPARFSSEFDRGLIGGTPREPRGNPPARGRTGRKAKAKTPEKPGKLRELRPFPSASLQKTLRLTLDLQGEAHRGDFGPGRGSMVRFSRFQVNLGNVNPNVIDLGVKWNCALGKAITGAATASQKHFNAFPTDSWEPMRVYSPVLGESLKLSSFVRRVLRASVNPAFLGLFIRHGDCNCSGLRDQQQEMRG